MLQQTTVKTVIPYYQKFLKRFPNVGSLARSRLDSVLRAWSGLGYYRRARYLHQAARVIANEYAGRFPKDLEAIKSLPGVGSYTAAAVASIAFRIPEPVLDGNVIRVMSRIMAYKAKTTLAKSQIDLRQRAQDFLSKNSPGDSNQALMELGATVCLPKSPLCGRCPMRSYCLAFKKGRQEHYPNMGPRPKGVRETWVAVVLYMDKGTRGQGDKGTRRHGDMATWRHGDRAKKQDREMEKSRDGGMLRQGEEGDKGKKRETFLVLKKNPKGQVNEGLYEFPLRKISRELHAKENLNQQFLKVSVRHSIMNRRMHVHVLKKSLQRQLLRNEKLISADKLDRTAISGLTRKILKLFLEEHSSADH